MENERGLIIDGRAISRERRQNLRHEIEELVGQGIVPGLDVILVGDSGPSQVYVRNKERACERLGIRSRLHAFPASTSQETLEAKIEELNDDDSVDGILLQLPLPKHLNAITALDKIDPSKDVDGQHVVSMGLLFAGHPGLRPCTPAGCMGLLDAIDCDYSGKKAVIVGRSQLVGTPLAFMLMRRNATITICHSRTRNLADEVREADIVVAAIGRPAFIKGDWIKEGAIVIDVGINRLEDGSLVGDVDFEEASKRASAITPVPGGVGPMTITMLLHNTLSAAKKRRGLV